MLIILATTDIYSSEIGFFPHQGLTYGTFFKKTYLYENDMESPLFKEKVLTMSFGGYRLFKQTLF